MCVFCVPSAGRKGTLLPREYSQHYLLSCLIQFQLEIVSFFVLDEGNEILIQIGGIHEGRHPDFGS